MKSKLIPIVAFAVTASGGQAALIVQELFDGISSGEASIQGAGDTATTIGLTGTWATHGSEGVHTSDDADVEGATLPGLPPNDGALGRVLNGAGSWSPDIYATRPLAEPIDFAADREIFFSVRLNNAGDTAMGIGLAGGESPDSPFVGAGFSWNNARPVETGLNEAGNATYISHGTMTHTVGTVNGTANVGIDGVYSIRAFEPAGSVNGHGLLVGRLTLNADGEDLIEIKRYAENDIVDSDPGAIGWTVASAVDSSMSATHLVLWMNGNGIGELDAIRIGESWADVTGVEPPGPGQPVLTGSGVGDIGGTGAQATVELLASAAQVTLHWDVEDKGTEEWTGSNPLGAQAVGPVSGAISGLTPDTRYFYRFHAVNPGSEPPSEAWSEAGRSFITSPEGKAVTDLAAEAFSAFEVDLTWTDIFATETGYVIQRSPKGAGEWTTVGTAGVDAWFHTDSHSGLVAGTEYDYRVFARNESGDSDFSNVASATTHAAAPMETQLLIRFDGSLGDSAYTLGEGEIDLTGSFRPNGEPTVEGGFATINPDNEGGSDGFALDAGFFGNLPTLNWVAETVLTYRSTGTGSTPVVIDVQGDCNLRLRSLEDDHVLQLFYYNGSTASQQFAALPVPGVPVHLAVVWDAASSTLTGYVNGVAFGEISEGAYATPAPSSLTFGYFGRSGFVGGGRGVDGVLDAVAFQTGTAAFDPASGFLILPESQSFGSWIGAFPVGGQTGFDEDPDGDGLRNGLEAFLGTNPSVADGGVLAQLSTDGTTTTFTHPIASPALSDVSGSYEWSTDLADWHAGDGADGPEGGPTVSILRTAQSGAEATVTATSSEALGKIFIRIKATRAGD